MRFGHFRLLMQPPSKQKGMYRQEDSPLYVQNPGTEMGFWRSIETPSMKKASPERKILRTSLHNPPKHLHQSSRSERQMVLQSPANVAKPIARLLRCITQSDDAALFDQRLSRRSNHGHAQHVQSVVVIDFDDCWCGQHWVVRPDIGGVLRCLFYCFHLFFAAGMVERADDNRLAKEYVFCGGHVCLKGVRKSCIWLNSRRNIETYLDG